MPLFRSTPPNKAGLNVRKQCTLLTVQLHLYTFRAGPYSTPIGVEMHHIMVHYYTLQGALLHPHKMVHGHTGVNYHYKSRKDFIQGQLDFPCPALPSPVVFPVWTKFFIGRSRRYTTVRCMTRSNPRSRSRSRRSEMCENVRFLSQSPPTYACNQHTNGEIWQSKTISKF